MNFFLLFFNNERSERNEKRVFFLFVTFVSFVVEKMACHADFLFVIFA